MAGTPRKALKIRCSHIYSTGRQCGMKAVDGGEKCDRHITQRERIVAAEVHDFAMQQMLKLVDPALDQIENMIINPDVPQHVKIKAITDLLDRVGLTPTKKVEKTTPVDEEIKRLVEELRAKG